VVLPLLTALATPNKGATAERDLAAAPQDFVEVEVATVARTQPAGTPAVLLREPHASDIVPIFIGRTQARSILRALRGIEPPRPMTHGLMTRLVDDLDARLVRVYVDDLRENTFLGMLELEVEGRDDKLRIDTRPSDAIALAIRVGASIHVAPDVIAATASIDYRTLDTEQVVTAAGIAVMSPRPELREALDLPDREGLVVTRAVGPAAGAGLGPGALIIEVNGETPGAPMEFLQMVRATPDGQRLELRYWREGEIASASVPTTIPEDPERGTGPAF
jgi:bifunctional DNase/RNase